MYWCTYNGAITARKIRLIVDVDNGGENKGQRFAGALSIGWRLKENKYSIMITQAKRESKKLQCTA